MERPENEHRAGVCGRQGGEIITVMSPELKGASTAPRPWIGATYEPIARAYELRGGGLVPDLVPDGLSQGLRPGRNEVAPTEPILTTISVADHPTGFSNENGPSG